MNPRIESAVKSAERPKFAYWLATALGAGYLKPGPGTWGSVVGVLLAVVSHPMTWVLLRRKMAAPAEGGEIELLVRGGWSPESAMMMLALPVLVWVATALAGVWSATRVARFAGIEDPQYVVIDEVSGVHLALLLALVPLGGPHAVWSATNAPQFAFFTGLSLLNWRYLLAGFVLFRAFDISKPFPCRRLERLREGWGIMADDWMAGVYAAICLRLALHFHLL